MIEIVYRKWAVSGWKALLVLFAAATTFAGGALIVPALAGATQTECVDEPIKCLGNSDGGSTDAPAKASGTCPSPIDRTSVCQIDLTHGRVRRTQRRSRRRIGCPEASGSGNIGRGPGRSSPANAVG